jgi:hypothetical protein
MLAILGCAATDDVESTRPAEQSTTSPGGDTVSLQQSMNVVTRGSYGKLAEDVESGRRRAPFVEVARNESELATLWNEYIGEGERPPVDLEGSIVVFLLMPPQPTGGYGIEPNGVAINGTTLEVDATLHQPGQTDIVTQAFTAPFAVIEVDGIDSGVDRVVWMNEGRPLATKMLD